MVEVNVETAVTSYAAAYQRLYNRTPRDIRILGPDWVLVNGARMHVMELEYLTRQLEREHLQALAQKRSIVKRLLTWFKQ